MKALVTGGGGFLGAAILRQLRQRPDTTTLRSLSRTRHAHLDAFDVEQVQADLSDLAAVEAAAEGCDVIFHVAARAGSWGPWDDFYNANVVGTENVLNACRAAAVPHLVYTSTPSVVFDGKDIEGGDESLPYPETYIAHYPHTKAIAERLVLAAHSDKLGVVALRPHLIWGPGDTNLIPRILERSDAGVLRKIGPGKLIDTVYIDDAARAHLLAADRLRDPETTATVSGKAFFISSGSPINTWEMVNRILATAGKPPVERTIPPAVAYGAGWLLEKVWQLTGKTTEPRMTRWVAQELAHAHWFDISAARRDLGYTPQVSLEDGMRALAEALGQPSR